MRLLLALITGVLAQPGLQSQTNFFGRNRDPYISFGASSYVSGPNSCRAFLECRSCTAGIGCVWSGTYCYQVKYQIKSCQGNGCATNPSQCLTTTTAGSPNTGVATVTTCNLCQYSNSCPNGMECRLNGGSGCVGTCQPITTECDYGQVYDSINEECVTISCVAANACPTGYTCNVSPCLRYPCPVVCTPPTSCNPCAQNPGCSGNQVCQPSNPTGTTSSYSPAYYPSSTCTGTCVDSAFPGPSFSCYSLSTCAACTASTNTNSGVRCVWNGVQCYPSNFPCYGRDCTTTPDRCPAACDSPQDCTTCTSLGCVWNRYGCSSMAASGCSGTGCAVQPSQCLAQQNCPSFMTCHSCLDYPGCQWSGTQCYYSTSQCTGYNCVTQCEDNQQTCSGVYDCLNCVSIAGCQWSGTYRNCIYRTTPCGPGEQCASSQSQCTAASGCSAITTCVACAAADGCLWQRNTCYSVPCTGAACAQLGYISQCPQPTCTNVYNCVDCVNTDGCLWTGVGCAPRATATCVYGACITAAQQCPESGCLYGEVWDPNARLCVATSCVAPTACPAGYSCQTVTNCGRALCPVQCTPPATQCGPNERWASCASSTCFESVCYEPDYATRVCAEDCRSGCQCMPGFARWQGQCISNCPHYDLPN